MQETCGRKFLRTDESGMTLVEVMVSLVVMGVVLVGLGQGLTMGIKLNNQTKVRVSGLNVCKQVMEKLKSEVQYSQAVFDAANNNASFNKNFYVDIHGNELSNQTASQPSTQNAPSAFFQVTVSVGNWTDSAGNTLSQTDSNGVSRVLVKSLSVKVLVPKEAISSKASDAMREIAMSVEMVRPSS